MRGIGIMAKKESIKGKYIHNDCEYCEEVVNEFLSITGLPILGECKHCEVKFLLRENTNVSIIKQG